MSVLKLDLLKAIQPQTLTLSERLSQLSVETTSTPYPFMAEWPESIAPESSWQMLPELISLHGMPEYEALSEEQKKKLAFYEAVNFYSLNIHGERSLMEGLAERLYRKWPKEVSEYLHHFLGEENKHMVLFGGFSLKYAGKIYPDRHYVIPREYAPGEKDFLFFAKVQVFEEIVDYYNYLNAVSDLVHPVAREINRRHRLDEARHLAFGRKITADLWAELSPQWSAETKAGIVAYLESYIVATLKEYYNPDVYRDAGLSEPYELMQKAWEAPSSRERRRKSVAKLLNFFKKNGILETEPNL